MPTQLFEMLENRSLLSVTLLTGEPADAAHQRQVEIEMAAADADEGSDDQMYQFLSRADDAIYEVEDEASGGYYAILAADIGTFDSGWDDSTADTGEIVHPWINFSDGPGDVDSSALAEAVEAAHKPTAILPDDRDRDERDEIGKAKAEKADTRIMFDFSQTASAPTYRGATL